MRRYFIIGDIHGEIRLLEKLLKEIESDRPDKLVFVGDYIDRGPHSKLVIDKLLSMDIETVCLMGNHEWMLLNAIENTAYGYSPIELWYYNGAEATLRSFNSDSIFSFHSGLDIKYLDFFRSLQMNHILHTGNGVDIIVTHAGISPEIPLGDQIAMKHYKDLHNYLLKNHLDPGDSFLWVRDQFFNAAPERWKNSMVVHGHTPVNKLRRFG
ncbi:MAG TPA: serine/threonine protein phosphatase, partial [Bacteroidaceae bacterium]|nr:serine/threonine protein phosphatase [Bacteroidaceae bacterium]